MVLDIYPDYTWQAEVQSISPATGAEFAILPPQNASGNWVKVVQRLPVRLKLIPVPRFAGSACRYDCDGNRRYGSEKIIIRSVGRHPGDGEIFAVALVSGFAGRYRIFRSN